VPAGAAALEMVSEQGISLLSVVEKKDNSFMLPRRRDVQSLDPEDREVRRRGRQVTNLEMER
jgi:hypothetical protein